MSSAAATDRCSRRKPSTRSRASGGSWGDSVAATSAVTMSSLRRRAIWTQRARSIARSSTGGARQRADDRAGVGGVDEQPQPGQDVLDLGALEEGARAHEPVGHRALLERDGERLALPAHGAHEHADVARRRRPARTSRSTSAATAWACARSFAQRQKRTRPRRSPRVDRPWRAGPAIGATTAPAAA